MKQLIEEQKKEFEKKYNTSVLIAYPEYVESHMILLADIWNWHKQSFKQFIDGLIAREEGEFQDEHPVDCIDGVTPVETYGYEATYNQAKKETISHLKKLKEELN